MTRTILQEDYISVDIEGPSANPGQIEGFRPIREIGMCSVWNTANQISIDFTQVSEEAGMRKLVAWLDQFRKPIFVSWNAYDYVWVSFYFWKYCGFSPFGVPGRHIDIKVYWIGKHNKPYDDSNKRIVTKMYPPIQKHAHVGVIDAVEQAQIFRQMLDVDVLPE
jgi:hypothetical protein